MPVSAHPSGQLGCGGLVGGQTGYGVGDLGGPLVGSRPSGLAGDLDGLAGMREQDPAAHGDNLDAAFGDPAVSPAALGGNDGHIGPGQVLELGEQRRLIRLHRQQIVRAALNHQIVSVVALGVQRISGDHCPGQIDQVQQRGELGDLVGLAADVSLSEHHTLSVIDRCQQMPGLDGITA